MKVLFICNQNQNRSKTAKKVFKNKFQTKSAGLYNKEPVTEEELEWADLIVVMEEEQTDEIAFRYPKIFLKKQFINLDIPDIYCYMQPKLINVLNEKINNINALTIV